MLGRTKKPRRLRGPRAGQELRVGRLVSLFKPNSVKSELMARGHRFELSADQNQARARGRPEAPSAVLGYPEGNRTYRPLKNTSYHPSRIRA